MSTAAGTCHSSSCAVTDRCTFSSGHSTAVGQTRSRTTPPRQGERLFATQTCLPGFSKAARRSGRAHSDFASTKRPFVATGSRFSAVVHGRRLTGRSTSSPRFWKHRPSRWSSRTSVCGPARCWVCQHAGRRCRGARGAANDRRRVPGTGAASGLLFQRGGASHARQNGGLAVRDRHTADPTPAPRTSCP